MAKKIEVIPAGVGGNTSKDMLARLDRDVLSKKPDWMTLSCGVNDVWHGATGVPLDQYQQNITSIVEPGNRSRYQSRDPDFHDDHGRPIERQ